PTAPSTLSLHDALPISSARPEPSSSRLSFTAVSAVSRLTSLCLILSAPFQYLVRGREQRVHLLRRAYRYAHPVREHAAQVADERSEEHTSELQSRFDLV